MPVSPSESAFWPERYSKGTIPMPTRFDRWILSNDSAMTALIPWLDVKKKSLILHIYNLIRIVTFNKLSFKIYLNQLVKTVFYESDSNCKFFIPDIF